MGQVLFLGWHSVKTRGRGLHCESQDLWTWVRVGHTQFWQSLDLGTTVYGFLCVCVWWWGAGEGEVGRHVFLLQDTPVLREVWEMGPA